MSEDIEMSERVLKFEFEVWTEKMGMRPNDPTRAEAYEAWKENRAMNQYLKKQKAYPEFAAREAILLAEIDRLQENNAYLSAEIAKLKESEP